MERAISVRRCKRTARILLHPLGTFKGYGAFVGINPLREFVDQSAPEEIGQSVIEMLSLSGPTGFHIKEIETYRSATANRETNQTRKKFMARIKSTAALARRFVNAEVSMNDRQKSWKLVRFSFDTNQKTLIPEVTKRVKITNGPSILGQTLIELLG